LFVLNSSVQKQMPSDGSVNTAIYCASKTSTSRHVHIWWPQQNVTTEAIPIWSRAHFTRVGTLIVATIYLQLIQN